MAVLTVLMCFTATSAFAQLKEVRGVQTRLIEYKCDKCSGTTYGFEFKNENNYDVWIEMELCTNGYTRCRDYIEKGIYDTKSITLKAGESYLWKCGHKFFEGSCCGMYESYHNHYFVKYKAYKAE